MAEAAHARTPNQAPEFTVVDTRNGQGAEDAIGPDRPAIITTRAAFLASGNVLPSRSRQKFELPSSGIGLLTNDMVDFVQSLAIETWTLWSIGIVLVACRM